MDLSSPSIAWSPPSSTSSFSTVLPEGNFSFSAKIIDNNGYFTAVSAANIDVSTNQGGVADTQRMSAILTQYGSLARSSQVILLADSIATT